MKKTTTSTYRPCTRTRNPKMIIIRLQIFIIECVLYNNLSVCIYVCVAMIQCDLQMLLNVDVVVVVVIVGITDSFDQLIWFCVFRYHSKRKTDIKTTITMAWMIEIPLRLHQCSSTRSLFLESMNMQIVYICYACVSVSHEWTKARSSSFLLLFLCNHENPLYGQWNMYNNLHATKCIDRASERAEERRNTCSVLISFWSCTLTLYLRCSTHLFYYLLLFCFLFGCCKFYFHSARIECVGENCKW